MLIVAQADGVADVAACGALSARLSADGAAAAELSIARPPAMPTVQVAELYRHGGGWKLRCLGDGYADGLAKLLTVHGIDVDDEPEAAPVVTPAPAAGGVRLTKGEEQLPVDMRKTLSMRKEAVARVMLSKGIADVRARVIVVLDASGSMAKLYPQTMQNSVERIVAVAAQLDDDGEMEAWRFASKSAQLPTLELAQLPQWLTHCVVLDPLFGRKKKRQAAAVGSDLPPLERVGIQNEEQKVIGDVRAFVRAHPTPDPTLVLFFSDGGVYRNTEIEKELMDGQREPIFWQFIGLGSKNGYGVLERFDTLPGRDIDNVGFFAIDDIDEVGDGTLYERILSEFPQWMRVAREAGIV